MRDVCGAGDPLDSLSRTIVTHIQDDHILCKGSSQWIGIRMFLGDFMEVSSVMQHPLIMISNRIISIHGVHSSHVASSPEFRRESKHILSISTFDLISRFTKNTHIHMNERRRGPKKISAVSGSHFDLQQVPELNWVLECGDLHI